MTVIHHYYDAIIFIITFNSTLQNILLQSTFVWGQIMFINLIFTTIVGVIHLIIVTGIGSNRLKTTLETTILQKVLNLYELTTNIYNKSGIIHSKHELGPHMGKVQIAQKPTMCMSTAAACLISQCILIYAISIHVDEVQHVFIDRSIRSHSYTLFIFIDEYPRYGFCTYLRYTRSLISIYTNDLLRTTHLTETAGQQFFGVDNHFTVHVKIFFETTHETVYKQLFLQNLN